MGRSSSSAGELLLSRRRRLGLSQRAAARACGVPQPMWSRIESGETQPSVVTLRRLLNGLGAELGLELRPMQEGVELRRERQRSLWLNRLVVGELARDPDRVIAIARDNLERWHVVHAGRPGVLASFDRWDEILDEGVEAIVEALTSRSEEAADLRQNSPFAGVLAPEQRLQALDSFRADWERRHGPGIAIESSVSEHRDRPPR